MSAATAATTAAQLAAFAPTARYEFAMHGEPALHPAFLARVATFRAALPKAQFQVTTNGIAWLGDFHSNVAEAFGAGLDFIVLDTYWPVRDRLRAALATLDGVPVYDYYRDCGRLGLSPWHNYHRKRHGFIITIDDPRPHQGEKSTRKLVNHCGNVPGAPIPPAPLAKRCTIPFREISICFDGDVCLCCNDFAHEYVAGNVTRQDVANVWRGPAFTAARRALFHSDRGFSPCSRCDRGAGSRPGLLPPQHQPSARDWRAIQSVVEAGTGRNPRLAPYFHPAMNTSPAQGGTDGT